MKRRRLTTVAVLGVLLATGLTACRADPSVAAYVDQEQITEGEVDEVADALRETLSAEVEQGLDQLRGSLDEQVRDDAEFDQADADQQLAQAEQEQTEQVAEQVSELRSRVVEMRILTEAANRYAQDEGVEVPAPDPARHAEQVGLAADHPFVGVVAGYFAVMGALQGTIEPVAPSEADQREVYDNLVAEGLTQSSFDEARQVLTVEQMGEAVALRDLYLEIIDRVDIEVNPRYDLTYRVPVRLGEAESWLSVPLGDPAVVEAA